MQNQDEFYKTIRIDGLSHKMATLLYDSDDVVRYIIGSFSSRQTLDQCLTNMQKGMPIGLDKETKRTSKKSYVCNYLKAPDENVCDGTHAVIYDTNERIIRIFEDENKVDKVFNWLKTEIKSGILPEWKSYLFNELMSLDLIDICDGFDNTGKAPKVLVMSKKITTELVRNIKSSGLRKGIISLPVDKNKEIDKNMTFLSIIQELIIPYLTEQKCQYNVGEEISSYLKMPLNSKERADRLYVKQEVITQGLLNSYKSNIEYAILNGGTGTGKTAMSIVLSNALINEVFNKKSGKIGIYCQGHLIEKWKRSFNDFFVANNIKHNFYVIENYQDVKLIPKNSDGIDVIIMPKDNVKRSYLIGHGAINQFTSIEKLGINKIHNELMARDTVDRDLTLIVDEISSVKGMKYIATKIEKEFKKKVVLYSPCYDNNGNISEYKVITTSDTLKAIKGITNKNYSFKVGTINELKNLIKDHIDEICSEKIYKTEGQIINPLICPDCGSIIYDKPADVFDEEKYMNYYYCQVDSMKESIKKCNGFIKADGTSLTRHEIKNIREGKCYYKIVKNKYRQSYMNSEGEFLSGIDLVKAKRNPKDLTILIRNCNEPQFTAIPKKGYICIDSAKYMKKLFGTNFIDVCLHDEAHLFAAESNQGQSFAYLCQLSRINIPLTGTLTGGKASDIFKLLFRLCPKKMIDNGYNYDDESLFVQHFGRRKRETIFLETKYNKTGRKVSKGWREIAGISPMLYSIFLSNNMVSRKIEDLNVPLPTIKYYKHDITMPKDLYDNYMSLKNQFVYFMKTHKGTSLGGSYIHSLISYPDMPQQEPITVNICGIDTLVAKPAFMELDGVILEKEQKLINTIEKELKEGRRTLVYATYTGEKGVSKRLVKILSRYFKVAELKGDKVKLKKREEWIQQKYEEGIEVIITNPECVATGLDIIQYPTIYFYECPTNTKTLRQSEKRAYRPNFIFNECRIYYSFYKGSFQEDLLKLQMSKKKASLALEGVFSEDLLSSMADGGESIESMLSKVLQGKIQLKENALDDYEFADESEITDSVSSGSKIEDIKFKEIAKENTKEQSNLTLFTVDDDFKNKVSQKKGKKAPIEGQIGFLF